MQKLDGNFHNYLGYERNFLDVDGSEDCMGRSLWSCGCVVNSTLPNDLRLVAKDIFDKAIPWALKTTSLRFCSEAIMGPDQYHQAIPESNVIDNTRKLADNFIQRYQGEVKDDWHWFEPYLTYDNARLTHGLFAAYRMVGDQKYLDIAKESMDFLLNIQMVDDVFVPIGNDGWYKRGGNRAFYDQQPLKLQPWWKPPLKLTVPLWIKRYLQAANTAFEWFLGKNSRNLMVYNSETGGCFDGLAPEQDKQESGS